MAMQIATVLSWFCLMAGSVFLIIGGIGLLRLPDFYSRVHAASITDTLGSWLIIIGLAFQAGFSLVMVKLLLILVFLILTSPLASHALTKAAFMHGLEALEGPQPRKRRTP